MYSHFITHFPCHELHCNIVMKMQQFPHTQLKFKMHVLYNNGLNYHHKPGWLSVNQHTRPTFQTNF